MGRVADIAAAYNKAELKANLHPPWRQGAVVSLADVFEPSEHSLPVAWKTSNAEASGAGSIADVADVADVATLNSGSDFESMQSSGSSSTIDEPECVECADVECADVDVSAYTVRAPSSSSTIRSSGSRGSDERNGGGRVTSSPTATSAPTGNEGVSESDVSEDFLPALDRGTGVPARNLRERPLPKARVIIDRPRHRITESIDFGVERADSDMNADFLTRGKDAVSTPNLPSLWYSAPSAHNEGATSSALGMADGGQRRVELVNLMETQVTVVPLDEDADFDFDQQPLALEGKTNFKRGDAGNVGGKKQGINYDDFMDMEEVVGQRIAAGLEEPYETNPAMCQKSKGRGRFFKKLRGKKEPESRYESRQAGIERRGLMVSGAVDRISMAADPFVDFITTSQAPPQKNRFSKFMQGLFRSGRERKLIKL